MCEKNLNPCDVCDSGIVRTAVTVNSIKVCHSCLRFFGYQARLNNRTHHKEVECQTKYMNLNT